MFEQFVQYILAELRLIAKAPLVFGAAVLFLGAIIWAALRWRYSGMVTLVGPEINIDDLAAASK